MLKSLFSIRETTDAALIRAASNEPAHRGVKLNPGLRKEQRDAVAALLNARPDFTVAIDQIDALPQVLGLPTVTRLQIFFGSGDDPFPFELLTPALRRPELLELRLHVPWLHDLQALDALPEGLQELSIDAQTDRSKVGLDVLRRFRRLRGLTLHNPGQAHSVMRDLTSLEDLDLVSPADRDHSYLSAMTQLRHLSLTAGGIRDLAYLAGLPNLRTLMLAREPKLADLAPLSDCCALEWLDLDRLPQVTALPDLGRLARLLCLKIEAMNGLIDFSGAARSPSLEVFMMIGARKRAAQPAHLEPVLAIPTLRHVLAGFGSTRLNLEFAALAHRFGKAWNDCDVPLYRERIFSRADAATGHQPLRA